MKKNCRVVEKIANNNTVDMIDMLEDLDWSTGKNKSPKIIVKTDSKGNEVCTPVFGPEDANKVINCVMDDEANGEDITSIAIGNVVKRGHDVEFEKDFVLKKNKSIDDERCYSCTKEIYNPEQIYPDEIEDCSIVPIGSIATPETLNVPTINVPSNTPININLKVENMTVNINMVDPNK